MHILLPLRPSQKGRHLHRSRALCRLGGQQYHTGEETFALLWRGKSKIQQYVHKSSLPVNLEEESVRTLCSLREQQNYNSKIIVCQTLYTGRATVTLQKKICLRHLLFHRERRKRKNVTTGRYSLCAERGIKRWASGWQTGSRVRGSQLWNLTDRSTRARDPVQSSLGLEGETSQFVTNRSLGATYGETNWWVHLFVLKSILSSPKQMGWLLPRSPIGDTVFLFQNVAFKFRSIMTELGGCHIVNILLLVVFY